MYKCYSAKNQIGLNLADSIRNGNLQATKIAETTSSLSNLSFEVYSIDKHSIAAILVNYSGAHPYVQTVIGRKEDIATLEILVQEAIEA